MQAEVIAIGDELTSGQRLDTNSAWLSQRLGEIGIRVAFHTTIGDQLDEMVAAFRAAVDRTDVVVATGGLGPTADDLTRDALARVAGVELVLDPGALRHVEDIFRRRGREMPQRNMVQAMFPRGSEIIPNPEGTAPGIFLACPRSQGGVCHVAALPGVPDEMRQMWHETLAGRLQSLMPAPRVLRHRCIKCFGTGESHLEQMLPDLIRRGRDPAVGITVSGGTISLRITAAGATAEACLQAMEPTVAVIRQCLGELIFGEDEDELQHAVVRLLRQAGQTLATFECGTAGRIARWMSELPEAAGYYLGGVVRPGSAPASGAGGAEPMDFFEPQAVLAATSEVRRQTGADLALGVGALPQVDPAASQPPQLHFALVEADRQRIIPMRFAGHPDLLGTLYAKHGLNLVRRHLLAVTGTV